MSRALYLRIADELHHRIAELAAEADTSMTRFCERLLWEAQAPKSDEPRLGGWFVYHNDMGASPVGLFDTEIEALRLAVERMAHVRFWAFGEEWEDNSESSEPPAAISGVNVPGWAPDTWPGYHVSPHSPCEARNCAAVAVRAWLDHERTWWFCDLHTMGDRP